MSKTTKIIAALGVVAGLGVAALPAFTYAANSQSVEGNADVLVDVEPAIAIKIVGNNDSATGYGHSQAKNPGTITSLDTLTATDLADYTNATAAVTSSSHASLLPNASVHGGTTTGATDFMSTITVYTNDTGYALSISGEGTNGALADMANQNAGSSSKIDATGIVKAGLAGWGYKKTTPVAADSDGTTANYDVAAATLTTGTGPTAGGDNTVVYYGVSTAPAQETGTYKATVTYTAVTNN